MMFLNHVIIYYVYIKLSLNVIVLLHETANRDMANI